MIREVSNAQASTSQFGHVDSHFAGGDVAAVELGFSCDVGYGWEDLYALHEEVRV